MSSQCHHETEAIHKRTMPTRQRRDEGGSGGGGASRSGGAKVRGMCGAGRAVVNVTGAATTVLGKWRRCGVAYQ